MKCNLCGVVSVEGFGTRRWNDKDVPLKRCKPCRDYFTQWRKAPNSKAKATERKHEQKPERIAWKNLITKKYNASAHGKAKNNATAKAPHRLAYQNEWSKTEKGRANNCKKLKKKYSRIKADPVLWFQEILRLSVRNMFRGRLFQGRFSRKVSEMTEFKDQNDMIKHFERQFTPGMTRENFGRGEQDWSIGHEIPRSYYDPFDLDDQKRCWKKANLFPQWHRENVRSNVKLPTNERLMELVKMGCGARVLGDGCLSDERRLELERKANQGRVFERA